MSVREPIYTALWNLIADASATVAQFVTTGRYLIPIMDLGVDKMPALFLIEHGEKWERKGKGIPGKRTFECSIVMYAYSAAQAQSYPATLVNNMMDALEAVLERPGNPPNPTAVQTLGGLVEHVYIEGEVKIIEGQLGAGENASVLVAPITILVP